MTDDDLHSLINFTSAQRKELIDARSDAIRELRHGSKWREFFWPLCCVPKRLVEPGKRLDRWRLHAGSRVRVRAPA